MPCKNEHVLYAVSTYLRLHLACEKLASAANQRKAATYYVCNPNLKYVDRNSYPHTMVPNLGIKGDMYVRYFGGRPKNGPFGKSG